jgi:hypothetical protein
MREKSTLVWIAIVFWIIIGALLIVKGVDYYLTEYLGLKDEYASQEMHIFTYTVTQTFIYYIMIVALAIILAIWTYLAKSLAWILGLMFSFYLFFTNANSAVSNLRNVIYVPSNETALFGLIIATLIAIFGILQIFVYFKPEVKNYFNKT